MKLRGGILLLSIWWLQLPDSLGDPIRDHFRQARPGYAFTFPRDHGSHPEFRLEWWYLTGHLTSEATTRRFGFQATFFRTALKPHEASETAPRGAVTPFGRGQAFLAHIALLDVTGKRLHQEERLNRQGWDAHASPTDLHVANGNWTLKRDPNADHPETMRLQASILSDAQFNLTFTPKKPKVMFGEDGISRKSSDVNGAAASHYISFTRLATSGTLALLGHTYDVEGQSWMDHEFSSSQLSPEQTGWDWASIQLQDEREIMLYRLRRANGDPDPAATSLTWIDAEGKQTRVPPTDWEWTPRRTWVSPQTKASYPIDFDLRVTDPTSGKPYPLRLCPILDAQEVVGRLDKISYWEGACDVLDQNDERVGQAYVELTGYDGNLAGRLR